LDDDGLATGVVDGLLDDANDGAGLTLGVVESIADGLLDDANDGA